MRPFGPKGEEVSNNKAVYKVSVEINGQLKYGITCIASALTKQLRGLSESELAIMAVEGLLKRMKEELDEAQHPRSGAV
jgi:hypothetical protein